MRGYVCSRETRGSTYSQVIQFVFIVTPHGVVEVVVLGDQSQSFVSVVQLKSRLCAQSAHSRTDMMGLV